MNRSCKIENPQFTTISTFEFKRLLEVQRAWEACFNALHEHRTEAFSRPNTSGIQCAIDEIRRLQRQNTGKL